MNSSAARITKPTPVPPLRDGDRMDATEFLRRYEADKVVHTAELLQGVVYVVRTREKHNGREVIVPPISGGHSRPQFDFLGWLGQYVIATPGVAGHGPITTILPSNATGLEPDGILRILPEHGGKSEFEADDYIHGIPELIIEVSTTSAARDLGPKYRAFEADAVPEYLVFQTQIDKVTWFEIKRKKYVPKVPHPDGTLRSKVFPGLWLDTASLFAGNLTQMVAVLQQGLASSEHAAFVAKLQRATKRKKK